MAIRLEKKDGYASQKNRMKQEKLQKIFAALSDEPLTATQIAEKTGLAEATVRHHLYQMENKQQLVAIAMRRVFGDQAKRYFALGTDISNIAVETKHRNKFMAREQAMCDFMRNNLRHKMQVSEQFNMPRKTTESRLREMQNIGLIKVMKAKQFPWRAAVQFYYSADSDMAEVLKSKEAIESKYAGMTRQDFNKDTPIYVKEPEIPDLPNNLLAMMGYTTHTPKGGKQYNVDQYSAAHQNWNKYQARSGVKRSNIGCAMQMMMESAPGAF